MEPDRYSSPEDLRAHARAVREASEQLRAHARALRATASRVLADGEGLRTQLAAASESPTANARLPGGAPRVERVHLTAQSSAAGPSEPEVPISVADLGSLSRGSARRSSTAPDSPNSTPHGSEPPGARPPKAPNFPPPNTHIMLPPAAVTSPAATPRPTLPVNHCRSAITCRKRASFPRPDVDAFARLLPGVDAALAGTASLVGHPTPSASASRDGSSERLEVRCRRG